MVSVKIEKWSAWAPGLEESGWTDWADGTAEIEMSNAKPALKFLPPMFRRRISQLSRMVLQVGHELLEEGEHIPVIFSSYYGEVERQNALSHSLLEENEISPAGFSLSVYNTPVSLLSIAMNNKSLASAQYAGNDSVAAGLFEALAELRGGKNAAVAIFADELLPEEYSSIAEFQSIPYAFGIRLVQVESDDPEAIRVSFSAGLDDNEYTHPLDFLKWILLKDKSPVFTINGSGLSAAVQAKGC